MISQAEVVDYLSKVARRNPRYVRNFLEKGDILEKTLELYYEIDDPEIPANLGWPTDGRISPRRINSVFIQNIGLDVTLRYGRAIISYP